MPNLQVMLVRSLVIQAMYKVIATKTTRRVMLKIGLGM